MPTSTTATAVRAMNSGDGTIAGCGSPAEMIDEFGIKLAP
jgi:hypothetical protein